MCTAMWTLHLPSCSRQPVVQRGNRTWDSSHSIKACEKAAEASQESPGCVIRVNVLGKGQLVTQAWKYTCSLQDGTHPHTHLHWKLYKHCIAAKGVNISVCTVKFLNKTSRVFSPAPFFLLLFLSSLSICGCISHD